MTSFSQKLDSLQAEGMLRTLSPLSGREGATVKRDGRTYVNLSSNDYLGIAGNGSLLEEFYRGISEENRTDNYGLGVASSRLLTGDNQLAHELEEQLGTLYGSGNVLLFNSGYHANIGILPALCGKNDLILSDKLNHASIHDGLRIGRADYKRYAHTDYDHLEHMLRKYRTHYDRVVIVSESVFSMDGDCADLARLAELKKRYDGMLYLDEAHAVGLYGRQGLGIAEQEGLVDKVDLLVGTFGKAFGSIGAFVVCGNDVRNYLINHSRSMIYTTALPPVVLCWNLFILRRIIAMTEKRRYLQQLSERVRRALRDHGLETGGTTNIIPVMVGSSHRALSGAQLLQEQGFLVMPVRPPTVPEGTSRFRLSLSADLQWRQVERLPLLIKECLDSVDL